MESRDRTTLSSGAEKVVAGPQYDGAGGREEGPPTPPGAPKESTALGEAADIYGNMEDAENLGYVERG